MPRSRTAAPAWIERQRKFQVQQAIERAAWQGTDEKQGRDFYERIRDDPVFFNAEVLGNKDAFGVRFRWA